MKRTHRNNKELNEVQHLKRQVQNLKSENRNLKKRLKQLERQEHNYEEIINDAFENGDIEIKFSNKPICPECGKCPLEESDLKFLIIKRCGLCKYEERVRTNS